MTTLGRVAPPRAITHETAWRPRTIGSHPAIAARVLTVAAVCVVAAGITLRTAGYLANWSLFVDDARLAINVGWHSLAELTRPLAFEQTAPLPLLWADRLVTRLTGVNEYALRAVPFAAGVLLLPAMWLVARRLLGAREALLATVLVAASPLLIQYSAYSVKPYATDALVTVLVLGLAAPLISTPGAQPRQRCDDAARWRELIAGGALALCASQPAAFVLGGVGVALLACHGPRVRVWAAAAAWLAVFGALYAGSYRVVASNQYLRWFWQGGFIRPGWPGWRWHAMRDFLETWSGIGVLPATATPRALGVVLAAVLVAGVAAVWRRHGAPMAALLASPYLLLVAASTAGRYPIAARVDLFALPLLVLLAAAVAVALVDRLPAHRRAAAYALTVAATLSWAYRSASGWFERPQIAHEPTRALVHTVAQAPAEEPVYVYGAAVPAWVFYSTDWRAPDTTQLRWLATVTGATGPAFENALSRGHPVGRDGDSLRYVDHGRTTVLGLGSGVAYDYYADAPHPAAPDPGWAANEMRRLRAASHGAAWLLASHYGSREPVIAGTEVGDLLAAARGVGGGVTCATVGATVSLFRIDFAPRGHRHTDSGAVPSCRAGAAFVGTAAPERE